MFVIIVIDASVDDSKLVLIFSSMNSTATSVTYFVNTYFTLTITLSSTLSPVRAPGGNASYYFADFGAT